MMRISRSWQRTTPRLLSEKPGLIRFGLKLYQLRELFTGYIWNSIVHTGKADDMNLDASNSDIFSYRPDPRAWTTINDQLHFPLWLLLLSNPLQRAAGSLKWCRWNSLNQPKRNATFVQEEDQSGKQRAAFRRWLFPHGTEMLRQAWNFCLVDDPLMWHAGLPVRRGKQKACGFSNKASQAESMWVFQ